MLKVCNLCSKSCHLKVPFSEEDFGRPLLLCQRRYGPPSLGTLEIYKYDDVYHLYILVQSCLGNMTGYKSFLGCGLTCYNYKRDKSNLLCVP